MRINVHKQRQQILARRAQRDSQLQMQLQLPQLPQPPERPPLPLVFARSGFPTWLAAQQYAGTLAQFESETIFDRRCQCFAVVPAGFWQHSHGRNLYQFLSGLPKVQEKQRQTDDDPFF